MDNNGAVVQPAEEKRGFSWSGFFVGIVIGAILFYLTIKVVQTFMYSLTAS